MATRYILIDSNSGFVWGEAQADSLTDAARAVDIEANGRAADAYEELGSNPRDSSSYYIAYNANGSDITIDDGQDQDQIDAVSALPVAGYVLRVEA